MRRAMRMTAGKVVEAACHLPVAIVGAALFLPVRGFLWSERIVLGLSAPGVGLVQGLVLALPLLLSLLLAPRSALFGARGERDTAADDARGCAHSADSTGAPGSTCTVCSPRAHPPGSVGAGAGDAAV